MIYILYYIEFHPGLPVYRPYADHVIGYMFDYKQVIINPNGEQALSTDSNPLVLRSLEEAMAHPWLVNLKWVFLHPYATKSLQEYEHPDDNVVYCIGSDWTGFGIDLATLGDKVDILRVCAPNPTEQYINREFFGSAVIPILAYDRATKLWQRQHSHTI